MLLDKIIFFSYATLFFLVPLIFSPLNFELFEFNKMLLVYLLTVVIMGTWLLKTINQKHITINRTPLDIPLLLFLTSQILSTIFSEASNNSKTTRAKDPFGNCIVLFINFDCFCKLNMMILYNYFLYSATTTCGAFITLSFNI